MDCRIPSIASAAGEQNLPLKFVGEPQILTTCLTGYPIATMPLGILDYNGRPFGLAIVAMAGREDLMFQFMSAFEAVSEKRGVPSRLDI
jgi:Asp-tRNA(Asn)/Glu-tRNA(Gln) amidotransferase A subunit family amidase